MSRRQSGMQRTVGKKVSKFNRLDNNSIVATFTNDKAVTKKMSIHTKINNSFSVKNAFHKKTSCLTIQLLLHKHNT